MKLKRLNIKRFGIYRDEKMEDIGPGLVVVGGRNRDGKSTLIEILKHIGYGFNGVPFEEKVEYEADADILLPNNEQLNISIKGLAEPKITNLSGTQKEYTLQDVYRGIDRFTYHRLFTISLEELQKIPSNMANKESARLQSVLLGAGLSEILYLPQIENELNKEAEKIGGKNGKASTKAFKSYNESIKKAVKDRNSALEDVEDYYRKSEEYEKIGARICELEKELIPRKEMELIKLETLSNLYTCCEKKAQLEIEIKSAGEELNPGFQSDLSLDKVQSFRQEYRKLKEDYEEKLEKFKQKIDISANVDAARDTILRYKGKIEGLNAELSGLKEKISNLMQQKRELLREVYDIKSNMNKVNHNWNEDFACIERLNTDQIKKAVLQRSIGDFNKASHNLEELSKDLNKLSDEKNLLEQQLEKLNQENPVDSFKGFFIWSLITAVLATLTTTFINPWMGLFLGVSAIGGIIIFFINRSNTISLWNERQSELNMKLESTNNAIQHKNNEIRQTDIEINKLQGILSDYKKQMGLQEDTLPDILIEYFNEIQSLKSRIGKVKRTEKELHIQEEGLLSRFEEIVKLIKEMPARTIDYQNAVSFDEVIDRKEVFFAALENLKDCLHLAEELDLSCKTKQEKELYIQESCGIEKGSDIDTNLQKLEHDLQKYMKFKELEKDLEKYNERIRFELEKTPIIKAFNVQDKTQDERMAVLESFFNEFSSNEEVKAVLEKARFELQELRKHLDEANKSYQGLEFELKQLSTTNRIEQAQKKIREARNSLRPLAEQYAVYRAAAFILKRVREEMVEKAKNQSLGLASEIFKLITGGDYNRILPSDELTTADFKAVQADNCTQRTVDILSRGTREQLFLSVRLSRIRELDPLPVIIDDSLVNFDLHHLKHTARLLTELSGRNQVFVLTCHPELVGIIAEQSDRAQYWRLEKGRFSLSKQEDLMKYLVN